jgi:hypothetical protein
MDKVFNQLKKYDNEKFNPKIFYYEDFLSIKFNLSKKLNLECFRNNDFDVIKIEKSKVYFDKDIILQNNKKCKILPLYIYDKDTEHLVSVIIDNTKNIISIFTNDETNKLFYEKVIKLFNLNYKLVLDNKNIKCDSYKTLCVPLSLLMIYSYFNNVNMNDYIKYINNKSIESSYNLIDNFLNYLEN